MGDASSAVGIGVLLVSLLCLGTWPALLRLCSLDEHQHVSLCGQAIAPPPRHPCHAYLDYGISYMIASLFPVVLMVLWQNSSSASATTYFAAPLTAVAMLGGTLLSLGNVAMQWSTSVYGAPLTTVLASQASLTVILGTSLNYWLQPDRTAHVDRLAWGVVLFLVAIALAARAQVWYHEAPTGEDVSVADIANNFPLGIHPPSHQRRRRKDYDPCGEIELESSQQQVSPDAQQQQQQQQQEVYAVDQDVTGNSSLISKQSDTSSQLQLQQHLHVRRGLTIAVAGGVCFGFFSPCFNIAVNDPFGWSLKDPLSVPAANLYFAVAFGICSVVGNALLMTHPPHNHITGMPVVPSSSLSEYSRLLEHRRWACAAGGMCAVANVLQFQGGLLAGFAAADLVQAFPLVATLWDVVLFQEFRQASLRVLLTLVGMYVTYVGGIVLLATSILQ